MKSRTTGCVIMALSAVFLIHESSYAQNPPNEIEVRIQTPDGRPIDRTPVFLLNDDYSEIGVRYTDGGGRCYFRGLSQGLFYLQIEPLGGDYYRQEHRIQMGDIMTSGGEKKLVEIQLQPKFIPPTLAEENSVFHQKIPAEARQAYELGLKNLDENDDASAQNYWKQALEVFPDYYAALDKLGTLYVLQKNYSAAIVLLHQATEINKNSWHSYYGLGAALCEIGQRRGGLAALRKALQLNPQSPNTNMRLGLELAKDPALAEDAIRALSTAARIAGNNLPDAYFSLASLYTKRLKYAEAASALESYVAALPRIDPAQKEQYRIAIAQLRKKAAKR
jgi:tetratricopeptide (TPR) repeat protein